MSQGREIATFGAGCFWGVEAAFKKAPGILATRVGFMGGDLEAPSYQDVISRQTHHVEVVEVTFDPEQITYEQLLKLFFFLHDPTQVDRQGNDVGDQYRSVIFSTNEVQKHTAEALINHLNATGDYAQPIATSVEPVTTFYPAEDYHQDYLAKNPGGYCHVPLGDVQAFIDDLTHVKSD